MWEYAFGFEMAEHQSREATFESFFIHLSPVSFDYRNFNLNGNSKKIMINIGIR